MHQETRRIYAKIYVLTPRLKAYLQIHIAVILFGLTAILGDLIQLSAVVMVWWRVLLTSLSLLFFIKFGKDIIKMPRKDILIFLSIGIIVGLHWICFYGSIKYANASVALVAMATTTFFTSMLEPLFFKRKIKKLEILLGIIIVPAMMLIASTLDFSLIKGFVVGLIAAFLASVFAILTKKNLDKADAFQITFLEIFGAFLFLSVVLPFYFNQISNGAFYPSGIEDWIYLLILSFLCTTLAYYLSVICLEQLSAFESNLVINLEPVYGILLAIVVLNDHKELSLSFYFGVILILLVVFSYPLLKKKFDP